MRIGVNCFQLGPAIGGLKQYFQTLFKQLLADTAHEYVFFHFLDSNVAELDAMGAPRCEFVAHTPVGWSASGDARAQADLVHLPFSPLRELVARRLAELASRSDGEHDSFERGSPVIHVWGPVMVIPFAGADETLSGLELIRRDSGARDVCVVVLDLAGAIIVESFGAVELERVIEATQQLGAEPILTGISPLSERAVAGLELAHLIVRKDLPDAIATAFQIAETLRRPA